MTSNCGKALVEAVQTDYKMVALLCACPSAFFASFYSENLGKSVSNGEIASGSRFMQRLISQIGRSQRLSIVNLLKRSQGLTVREMADRLGHELHGCKAALLESST